MRAKSISRRLQSRILPILQIMLWLGALIGYFSAWVTRQPRSAALSWNAYELFNLLRFLPEIETQAISANLHTFRLPVLGLAVVLPLLVRELNIQGKAKLLTQIGTTGLSALLCVMTLPPYPEILTAYKTPGWRVAFWWAIAAGITLGFTWKPLKDDRVHIWSIISVLLLTGIPALITRQRLNPALVNLHQAPVQWGIGLWLWAICTGLLLLVQWAGMFLLEETR